ncbi:MAG: hypothetical protein CMJ39_03530 [Phycisphaerae bacterium]|nr:hypothetical protein [Phycisphaerae bacterium]
MPLKQLFIDIPIMAIHNPQASDTPLDIHDKQSSDTSANPLIWGIKQAIMLLVTVHAAQNARRHRISLHGS